MKLNIYQSIPINTDRNQGRDGIHGGTGNAKGQSSHNREAKLCDVELDHFRHVWQSESMVSGQQTLPISS